MLRKRKATLGKVIAVLTAVFMPAGIVAPMSVFAEEEADEKIRAFIEKYGLRYEDIDRSEATEEPGER